MRKPKGSIFDHAGFWIAALFIFFVVIIAIKSPFNVFGDSCAVSVDSLIEEFRTTATRFNNNVETGQLVLRDKYTMPYCVRCVYENTENKNMVFELIERGDKTLSKEDYNIGNVIVPGDDKSSCEESGIEGNGKYKITLKKDSIDVNNKIEVIFEEVDTK